MLTKLLLRESNPQSEEVKDIIERMPETFGRIITRFLIFLAIALALFGYFIKYPDVVRGELTLNASVGPVRLISNASGKLHILSGLVPKSRVRTGSYIGYIENAARLSDVRKVDSLLKHLNLYSHGTDRTRPYLPEKLSLGELNERYFAFVHAFYTYANHFSLSLYEQQEAILSKQATSQKSRIKSSERDAALIEKAYSLLLKSYRRDSTLHIKNVLSIADLERTRMELLTAQRSFETLKSELLDSEFQLEDVLSKLQQVAIQKVDNKVESEMKLTSAYYELMESIRQWELKYVLVAPIDGTLEYANFWKENDYINQGQEIFTLLPDQKDEFGQVLLPENGAGKVMPGQKVVLKLNDFPYNEFGSIEGQVKDVSLVTNQKANVATQKENLYLVTVILPKGLLTNYKTKLNFKFGAKGTAEIITADRRLFHRLFENLRYQANK